MGKPAARIGDMTMHGGSIVVGCPTVLIGGMPAARLGDMHVCPMMTPGTPPIPHVGGPVSLGSTGVLIGGQPAARMGDMCVCVGPPDSVALGCMTVLIGEAGGGGGGGGGGGAASAASAANASAAVAQIAGLESTTKHEHWVEFQFVDKAGLPVSGVQYKFTDASGKEVEGVLKMDGRIRRDALSAGQCTVELCSVSQAQWSKQMARAGEKIKMTVVTEGFEPGTPATFQIYSRDVEGPDILVASVDTVVKGNKTDVDWQYEYSNDDDDPILGGESLKKYYSPEFYFTFAARNIIARSSILGVHDELEIVLKDENGKPIPNEEYVVFLSNGETRRGKLDSKGSAIEKKIPVKTTRVVFPNVSQAKKLPR